jgi:hypothetical protein
MIIARVIIAKHRNLEICRTTHINSPLTSILLNLINYCPQVCFLDVSVTEGEKAQKSFDEKYGSGKAVFLKCDVSKKGELRGTYTASICKCDSV